MIDIVDWKNNKMPYKHINHKEKTILNAEANAISNIHVKLFGHYLLQLGGHDDIDILNMTSLRKLIYLNEDAKFEPLNCDYNVCGYYDELPFLPGSIDAVAIFHVLEFVKQPRQVLREIFDVLIPEGYAIIYTFNPYCLLNPENLFKRNCIFPWQGHQISASRLAKWLNELGFTIISHKTLLIRQNETNLDESKKANFNEGIRKIFLPSLGNVNMFVVQKKVMTLTRVRSRFLRWLLPEDVNPCAKPTTRERI